MAGTVILAFFYNYFNQDGRQLENLVADIFFLPDHTPHSFSTGVPVYQDE